MLLESPPDSFVILNLFKRLGRLPQSCRLILTANYHDHNGLNVKPGKTRLLQ